MKLKHTALWSGVVAAALLLTACGKSNSGSGSMSSSGMSSSTASTAQNGAWKTGLGVLTETTDDHRTGKINLVAAAVLLDGEGKIIDVTFDELESTISADGSGVLSMPTDTRTKRQKGDDYPLAAASGIKKGWTEQADAFADYLKGMTAEKVAKLETEEDGKPKDAVAKACANAEALGAAKGDRVSLGIEAANASSDVTATDDKDVNAQVDVTIVALTTDSDGRVTSAIGDMAEPALTVMSDGNVMAPDAVKTKLEQGDSYGMRGASSLGKEWYEHSEGFCSYLKGKTAAEIAKLPAEDSDADLAALCTIDVTELQKAAAKALEEAK